MDIRNLLIIILLGVIIYNTYTFILKKIIMKFITHGQIDINGTHLQGSINCSYETLVKVFGQHSKGDEYKVDAEWEMKFEDGTVATIYNWKNGKNYCGSSGIEVKDITNWHIGGHKPQSAYLVNQVVKQKG